MQMSTVYHLPEGWRGRGPGLFGLITQWAASISDAVSHVLSSLLCSPSALRPGSCVGHRMWILLAMTHLTLDFSTCSPLSQGLGIKLTSKSVSRSRSSWQPLWDSPNKIHWRTVSPLAHRLQNPFPPTPDNRVGIRSKVKVQKHQKSEGKEQATCKECRLRYPQMETGDPLALIAKAPKAPSSGMRGDTVRLLRRTRRQLKWDSYDKSQEGRTTTVAGFIDWGPTGTDSIDDDGKLEPNITLSTRVSTTTVATTTSTTTRLFQRTFTVVTTPEPKRLSTTRATVGETVKPPKPYGDTPGKIQRLTNDQPMWSSWLIWMSKVEKMYCFSLPECITCFTRDFNTKQTSCETPHLQCSSAGCYSNKRVVQSLAKRLHCKDTKITGLAWSHS